MSSRHPNPRDNEFIIKILIIVHKINDTYEKHEKKREVMNFKVSK